MLTVLLPPPPLPVAPPLAPLPVGFLAQAAALPGGRTLAVALALCMQARGLRSRTVVFGTWLRTQFSISDDGARGRLAVTCVLAEEIDAPAGARPVVWRLLSNRAVGTLAQAVELIEWYRVRWEIELYFLILKEGCRIEALQLGDVQRIETALALYLVVAWRINRLMRLGRSLPQLSLVRAQVEEPDTNKKPILRGWLFVFPVPCPCRPHPP